MPFQPPGTFDPRNISVPGPDLDFLMGGGGEMQPHVQPDVMPWDMPREMGAGFPGGPPIGRPGGFQRAVMPQSPMRQATVMPESRMQHAAVMPESLMMGGFGYESPFAGGEYGSRGYLQQHLAEGGQIRPFEGLIAGSGGGMDDSVVASIEGNEPILVSRDEYVVPADVVSALGDGSSRHGAQLLDGMNSQVRMAKNGSPEQPGRLNVSPLDLLRGGG